MSRAAQLEKLHALDPLDADVMYMLATERLNAGEFVGAIEWFDKCLGADPGYCYAYYHKARALEDAGRAAEAKQALREGLGAARKAGDAKATGELSAFLERLGG